MRKLARYLKLYKKQVIFGPIFKWLEAVFELIVPLCMAQIIDVGVAAGDRGYVLRMGGVIVLLGVVGLASSLTCQYFASVASQGVGTALRRDLFQKINSLSHAELDRVGVPSLITRMVGDVNQLQLAVAMLIRLVVRAPFLAVGATVMAMLIDWKLSLIFLIAMPLIALALYLVMSRSVPYYKKMQKQLDRVSLITRENLAGVRVIRAFGAGDREKRRFDAAADEYRDTTVAVGKISALLNPAIAVIANLAIVAIIWFGGVKVDAGGLSQGEIIALVNYMMQIMLAMVVVANLVVIFTRASASAARVNEIFELQSSVTDPQSSTPAPQSGAPAVAFEQVSFAYPGTSETALAGLDFRIAPGETFGIIGPTGSGKSTLVALLLRFYDVTSGCVRVDGVDVRDYPQKQLRGRIGYVPQRAVLFSGTLRDNLKWRVPDATDEQIWAALDMAQASEFVSRLRDGLDTQVEQGGLNFSGGQRQRLTIARALVGDPEILILDDSASALDFATEAALRRALRERRGRGATILISQRLHTIRGADQILVLDDGAVCGLGDHDTLYATCPAYREICQTQLETEEAGA